MKSIRATISRWKKILYSLKSNLHRLDQVDMNLKFLLLKNFGHLKSCNTDQKQAMQEQEFKIYSQNGEDGLLLYIFSKIGITNKTVLEIGIGDGRECNSANLLINFNWDGLLIDGNPQNVVKAEKFYKEVTKGNQDIQVINHFVDRDNIRTIIKNRFKAKNFDLLSIDIDGNDYWIWEAINNISPRVVIIEYNASFGAEESVTVPYEKNFNRYTKHKSGWYHGASLKALCKLGRKKGYSLICCDQAGVNVIFVKDSELNDHVKPMDVEDAFVSCAKRDKLNSPGDQLKLIGMLPVTEVK